MLLSRYHRYIEIFPTQGKMTNFLVNQMLILDGIGSQSFDYQVKIKSTLQQKQLFIFSLRVVWLHSIQGIL